MSATLPPAPPRPPRVDPPQDLDALIEEARRRARRRRALYGLSALLAAGAAVAGFWDFHNGGGGGLAERGASATPAAPAASQQGVPQVAPRRVVNGPLAIIAGGAQRIQSIGLTDNTKALFKCGPRMCGELESVAWSPDGKTLAYGAGSIMTPHPQDGLHLLDLASGKSRRIGPSGDWFDLAWSRDGTKLAYVSGGNIFIIRTAEPQRPAAPLRIAGDGDGATVPGVNASPAWSPTDRTIAYASAPKGESSSGIYLANLEGSHERRLAEHGFAPAWSPDGSMIAYSVRCGIRLVTPTGRNVTPSSAWKCAHIGVAGSPAWSPDGRKIAVAGKSGIYVMNADGSLLRRVWTVQPSYTQSYADSQVAMFGLWRARPAWQPIPR